MLFEMPLVLQQWLSDYISPYAFNFLFLALLCITAVAVSVVLWDIPVHYAYFLIPFIVYSPVMYDLLHSAYTEIFFSLILLLATYEYQRFTQNRGHSEHWYRCVILLGIGCDVKYFCLIFIVVIFLYPIQH